MSRRRGSSTEGMLVGLGILVAAALVVAGYVYLDRLTQKGNRKLERSFQYDDTPLRRVDPALIKYDQVKQVPTGLTAPTGIAIIDGYLVVVGDRQVRVLDADGAVTRTKELDARPTCVAVGADGALWVGFVGRIEKYPAAEGAPALSVPLPDGAYITSIAPDGEDAWVADAGRKLVLCVDGGGKIKQELKGKEGLLVPSPHLDVAVKDNLVWVANPGKWRLEAYGRDGQSVRSFGRMALDTAGFVGCCNPSDFAILPDGKIVTSEKGAARVKVFDTSAALESVVADATTLGHIEGAMDVAADSAGRIYVLDTRSKSVRVFERRNEP